MLIPLADAVGETCGPKAGALGTLLRAGMPVPAGAVVPMAVFEAVARDLGLARLGRSWSDAARRAIGEAPVPHALRDAVGRALEGLGDAAVAVRSSATDEDTVRTSAAGQHESVLAVRGVDDVVDAIRACWVSLYSPRAVAYRSASSASVVRPSMGVLVQRLVDADVSGVLFTGLTRDATQIEASWGLGPSVVGGTVTPDAYRVVTADGAVSRRLGDKRTRVDRHGTRLVTVEVPDADRRRPTLDDATAARIALLGGAAARVLGGAQDVEWAMTGDDLWVLQARPVTADVPAPRPPAHHAHPPGTLTGTPGSRGTATGPARVVRGPGDFTRVRAGDVLVCPWTDPGWTPLLGVVAGVVTEEGGALSHAAIVARERGIPAVLGVRDATTRLRDGTVVTVDGAAGTVGAPPR